MEKIHTKDSFSAQITRGGSEKEELQICGTYDIVCHDADGNEKWKDTFPNLVTTAGKNALLDAYMGNADVTAGNFRWFMGLIVANGYSTVAVSDTMSSHAGWLESGANGGSAPGYSQATRRQLTFAAASSGSKATSNGAVFSINVSGTAKGAFIANNDTKAGTTGTLFSAGLFTLGDKALTSGDTLSVTYTASA